MKKVLFATTALVASAGMASADVAVSGYAEAGIFGNGNGAQRNAVTQFHTDIDVTFTMSGETDNGITFGATVDLDESNTAATFAANGQGGETIFVSSAWGTLTMGDTDGALDFVLQEVNLAAASIADDETVHVGFNGNFGLDGSNDGQVARYDYSFGDFTFALSAEIDDWGQPNAANAAAATVLGVAGGNARNGTVFGVGVGYDYSMTGFTLGFGAGYQSSVFYNTWGASLDVASDMGFTAGVSYVNYSETANQTPTGDVEHFGIGVGYTMDAISVGVNYGSWTRARAGDTDGIGVAAQYDLGGGMALHGGWGWNGCAGVFNVAGCQGADYATYSLGASMSF